MWKWHERKPWGAVTLRKGLLLLLPRVCADSLAPFSVAKFIVTAMNAKSGRLFTAVTCFDYLDCMPVEKTLTIKANISLLDRYLYPKRVLWSWSLSKDSSREKLTGNCSVAPIWPTVSIADLPNSQFSSLLHNSKKFR